MFLTPVLCFLTPVLCFSLVFCVSHSCFVFLTPVLRFSLLFCVSHSCFVSHSSNENLNSMVNREIDSLKDFIRNKPSSSNMTTGSSTLEEELFDAQVNQLVKVFSRDFKKHLIHRISVTFNTNLPGGNRSMWSKRPRNCLIFIVLINFKKIIKFFN